MVKQVLVTGGNGFLGMRLILELLKRGEAVKTTVRGLDREAAVRQTLEANGVPSDYDLTFVAADLEKDDGWVELMSGIDQVYSAASPVFFGKASDPEAAMRPAIDGTLRILKAAHEAHVKRVVMTANFGAVGFSKRRGQGQTTEADWTNPDEPGLSLYEKSKLLAEKAAWDYVKTEAPEMEFATVNPGAIMGPSLDAHVSGSFSIIQNMLDPKTKRLLNFELNVADVRDVVDIHIRAMNTPAANGHRFIASEDGKISMREIATLIQQKRPALANRVPVKNIPGWLLSLMAPFNAQAKGGRLFMVMNRDVSNEAARQILGWEPLSSNEEAVLASVDSLVKYQLI